MTPIFFSAASIIYIKVTYPTKNKQQTLTVSIFGQANGAPLKATYDSHLGVLLKIPDYERKSATLTGLMNNLLGLPPLCGAGIIVTLDKYSADMKF